jgi:hypothetical protein
VVDKEEVDLDVVKGLGEGTARTEDGDGATRDLDAD